MMSADQPVSEQPPAPRPRRRRRRWLVATLLIFCLLIGGAWLARIWVVRNRVIAALEGIGLHVTQLRVTDVTPWHAQIQDVIAGPPGALKVERISVDYSPGRLFQQSVNRIRITGAEVGPALRDALKIEPDNEPDASPLPFTSIELAKSSLVIGEATIPVEGSITNDSGRLLIRAVSDLSPKPVRVSVLVNGQDFAGSIDSEALDTQVVHKVLQGLKIDAPEMSGWIGTRIAVAMQKGYGSVSATLRPEAISFTTATGDQLNVEKGVITFERSIGPGAQSAGSLTINGVNASSSTYDVWMEGISGGMTFNGFSPLVTPPEQRITVARLNSGKVKLADGVITVHGRENGEIVIQRTTWRGLGGTVASENATIRVQEKSAELTVVAQDVSLRELLEAFGQGKATGQGRVNATIPIRIQDGNVTLGEGSVVAVPGGFVQIRDTEPLVDMIASRAPESREIREDLPKALADFEFQTLRADLRMSDNDLRANVRLAGRGRVTKTRPYDLEFRINRVNEILKVGLGVQRIFQGN